MSAIDLQIIKQTFLSAYHCDEKMSRASIETNFLFGSRGVAELFSVCNGASFEGGLYRLNSVANVASWNNIVCEAFPQFIDTIQCFAFDWLGRIFALDSKRLIDGQPSVLMLEPGTGHSLEIPATFLSFHCKELIDYAEAALALDAYGEWRVEHSAPLGHAECVGYKTPLFLGGEDKVSNMERTDMTVYWELCSQLLRQTRSLPDGSQIGGVLKQ